MILSQFFKTNYSYVHTEELIRTLSDLTPKSVKMQTPEFGAVLIRVGGSLQIANHDGRSPDYDDWTASQKMATRANGDILVWNDVLGSAFELSSMGSVLMNTLRRQVTSEDEDRLQLSSTKALLNESFHHNWWRDRTISLAMFLLHETW